MTSNPPGDITISAPMTYVSSEVTQPLVDKVGRGTENNQILRVVVVTSSSGAPVYVNQVDFNLSGTTAASDVTNMKVWYTGNSNQFATDVQFGSDVSLYRDVGLQVLPASRRWSTIPTFSGSLMILMRQQRYPTWWTESVHW